MAVSAVTLLADEVAVVTGGARGIGRSISKKLAQLGAHVVVNYSRSQAQAEELVKEINAAGGRASAICFDVADSSAVDAGFKAIQQTHGRVDILVNNAGIARDGLILRAKDEDWKQVIDINLSGCFYCARAVTKLMLKSKKGRIINISSVIGEMGNAGQVVYATSKSGIFGLTKSLARELGSRGITVNAITPGYIKTEMTGVMSEEQTQAILNQVPLGRLGEPEDVAELVAFLSQAGAGYITGQIIGINGGLYM